MRKNYLYFHDKFRTGEEHVHPVEKILLEQRTHYQFIQLVESPVFEKMLIIDGDVQSTLRDEYIYHEALVHPAMLLSSNPEIVVILGGGEGATLREVLKHKSLVKALMIDIDKDATDIAKEYLNEWHKGSFDDKRSVLISADARVFIEREVSNDSIDTVISDLTEPFEGGPSYKLFTKEFYEVLYNKLKDDGVLALQSSLLRVTDYRMHSTIRHTLQKVFPIVRSYLTYIPSFDTTWSFIIASKKGDPLSLTKEKIDELIANKITGEVKFYDGTTHISMFSIPKDIRSLLSLETDIITDESPVCILRKENL